MIAHIQGTVIGRRESGVVVETGGIGYLVHVTPQELVPIAIGSEVQLHTHHVVRDDAQDLYGFPTLEELGVFELLLGVPGIGPKSALSILGLAGIDALRAAVSAQDTSYLTRVSGIGKKNAEKILLELNGKLPMIDSDSSELAAEADVIEALVGLGYGSHEAREALKQVPKDTEGVEARLKAALTRLGK